MPAAAFRVLSTSKHFGPICPDCAGPKANNARRCRRCWKENVLRARPEFWAARTCPECGGPKTRGRYPRCRPCTNAVMRGKPRTSPVVPSEDHIWRRKAHAESVKVREALVRVDERRAAA